MSCRASRFLTFDTHHPPPRRISIPCAFSASATARSDVTPAPAVPPAPARDRGHAPHPGTPFEHQSQRLLPLALQCDGQQRMLAVAVLVQRALSCRGHLGYGVHADPNQALAIEAAIGGFEHARVGRARHSAAYWHGFSSIEPCGQHDPTDAGWGVCVACTQSSKPYQVIIISAAGHRSRALISRGETKGLYTSPRPGPDDDAGTAPVRGGPWPGTTIKRGGEEP